MLLSAFLPALLPALVPAMTLLQPASPLKNSLSPPQLGEPISQFVDRFLAFIATPIVDNIPQKNWASLVPDFGIDASFNVIRPLLNDEFPNFHKKFPVNGLEANRAQWFVEAEDRKKDDPVIIYTHGGGFDLGFFPFFPELARVIYRNVENPRLSFLFLDYTLSLRSPHPQQLTELARVYDTLAKTSNNIWLMGDSAGGALSLMLARHLQEPYPGAARVETDQSPRGLILLSPWVNLYPQETAGTSYVYNKGKDFLTAYTLRGMGEVFQPDVSKLENDDRFTMHKTDWSPYLPTDHDKIFVSMGQNEVLLTDIRLFVDNSKLKDAHVFEAPGAFHDDAVFHPKKSPATLKLVDYIRHHVV